MDLDWIIMLLQLGVPLFLLMLGLIVGRTVEKNHLKRLDEHDRRNADMLLTNVRSYAPNADPAKYSTLVMGQAVIATDYLKSFLAAFRKILGGRVRSYESLMERAKRESIAKMIDEARAGGFNAICNIRVSTADIGGMTGAKGAVMAEAFASGTAYYINEGAPAPIAD